ncbi:MAG TPA: acetate/propionate family kinase [Candidatus Sulfotelmatobacter sp.]|jgi:acetate kinase|nr:acetate/propionate family kinase [Candidatus Sulfotelmatobacter sp.]
MDEVGRVKELGAKGDLILALNSGSSSLKFGVYFRDPNNNDDEMPLLTGSAEGIGRSNGSLNIRSGDGTSLMRRDHVHESQSEALTALCQAMQEHAHVTPFAVGHRIVHGGPKLCAHQRITPKVLDELRLATHFAPLHIPQALTLIAAAQSIFPSAAHFACFDDAFHQTMPETASRLPIPKSYFDAGIRRYGFHGISYESLVHYFGGKLPQRAIFAHLGNGSSLCALRNGVSVDTTMGFTPTGGIPMGTRSGDLDPGVLLYLSRNAKLSTDDLEVLLNHHSGLFAFSGGESDVKTLEERARSNDRDAALALDAFAISVRKTIGAYMALLGGVDLLVFTGGIGQHSQHIRSAATDGLEHLGLTADKIQIVPTREEQQIARHCRRMMMQSKPPL